MHESTVPLNPRHFGDACDATDEDGKVAALSVRLTPEEMVALEELEAPQPVAGFLLRPV